MQTSGTRERIVKLLVADGYEGDEIARGIQASLDGGQLRLLPDGRLHVDSRYRDTARRYMLLDLAARNGLDLDRREQKEDGLVVPGYGPFRVLSLAELSGLIRSAVPEFVGDFADDQSQLETDIDWLVTEGLAMRTAT